MARTLTKEKPVRDVFLDGVWGAVANSEPNKDYDDKWWEEKPVTAQEFATDWIGEPLYPIQKDFVDAMTGKSNDAFEVRYDEAHGFWGKGCFRGKEKISLLNGEEKTFEELVKEYPNGKNFWVYSVDKNNKMVAGKASDSRVTKKVKQLIEITLDNGKVISSTLDHLYLMRDGEYKQACDLMPNDSLMPLYKACDSDGYEKIYNPGDNKKHHTHKFIYGENNIKDKEVLHHSDLNKRNNEPVNIIKFSSQSEHSKFHHALERTKKANDPEYSKQMKIKRSKAAKLAWKNNRKKYMDSFSSKESKDNRSMAAKKKWKNPDYIKFQKETMAIVCNTDGYKKKISDVKNKWYAKNKDNPEFQNWLKERSEKGNDIKKAMNHKVVSTKIITLSKPIPVYDITVEEYHNFALSAGVFVHNSGKDRTISKMQAYVIYKLMCLKNPQKFLREKYGCSIGDGDAIDLANMSINARQAQNVYFKKFKQLIKACINPKTGKNWFVEKGVDLRDGYDMQNVEARFKHNITAHSLNSETNTGEGLNIFLATIDEFGSFAFDNAFELLDAIRDTVISRFPKVGKVCVISYKYYHNDPMHVLYMKEKDNPRVYSSLKASFEVNLQMSKTKLSEQYKRNPEKSKMTYECLGGESTGGYISKKYMISKMFTPEYENPIKGDLLSIDGALLSSLKFKDWFKGSEGRLYALHVDMATGRKSAGNDCAGLGMVHIEKMFPKIDDKLKKELYADGIAVDFMSDDPELVVVRKGIIADLVLQLVAKQGTELQFSDVRKFIIRLKQQFGFNIIYVTYDGWQSRDSIQILNQSGMNAENFSVDKNNEAYDTWKELMYQQLFKTYPQAIGEREAKELIINTVGKVDHPEESWDRYLMENTNKGSKDIMDALVGAGKIAFDKFNLESDVFFG